jgi:hypothetical protein
MKHTRKMVLIDYDRHMNAYKPEHELDTAPQPLHTLQHGMHNVLNDTELPDYEKQNRYLRELNRFLFLNKLKRIERESDAINELEMSKIKEKLFESTPAKKEKKEHEFFGEASPKKEKIQYQQSTDEVMSDDDSDSYVSTYEKEIERSNLFKMLQGAIPKPQTHSTPKQSTPKTPEQSGSPYEIYRSLRNRDIPKPKSRKKSNNSSKWNSFEDINKTLK